MRMSASDRLFQLRAMRAVRAGHVQGLPPDPEPGPGPGDDPGLGEAQEAA